MLVLEQEENVQQVWSLKVVGPCPWFGIPNMTVVVVSVCLTYIVHVMDTAVICFSF